MIRNRLPSSLMLYCGFFLLFLLTACDPNPVEMNMVDTPSVARAMGGTIKFTFLGAQRQKQVTLNQTSSPQYYVLAKLVQPGVASLDLVLTTNAPIYSKYQADVSSQDLMRFQAGAAEIDITTPDGTMSLPLMLQ